MTCMTNGGEAAIFNELSSNPASSEGSKCPDAYGLLEGSDVEQGAGEQSYIQAQLGDYARTMGAWPEVNHKLSGRRRGCELRLI